MHKNNVLLNEAGIPFGVRDISLKDDGAPSHLISVVSNIAHGEGNFFNGFILTAAKDDAPSMVIQAFAVVAKEVALESMDAMYVTPLQLLAILTGEKQSDTDPKEVEQLFIDSFFIEDSECPFTLREKAMLREFVQHRMFDEGSTSILSFGSWSRANQWYDRVLVSLFRDHAEVAFHV